MSDESRDVLIRLILQLPDNKLPPIDTRAAEESLERLRRKASSVGAAVGSTFSGGARPGGAGPGGTGPGGGMSAPGIPAAPPSSPVSPALPPVPSLPGFDYDAAARGVSRGLNQFRTSLSGAMGAGTSLVAGLALRDLAQQQSDPFESFLSNASGTMTAGLGSIGLAYYGYRGVRGLASAANNIVSIGAARAAKLGLPVAESILSRLAAPVGLTGSAVVGAGVGALAYTGYELYDAYRDNQAAIAEGQRLDARNALVRRQRADRSIYRNALAADLIGQSGRDESLAMLRFAAGDYSAGDVRRELNSARGRLAEAAGGVRRSLGEAAADNNPRLAVQSAERLVQLEQERYRLVQATYDVRRRELAAQTEQIDIAERSARRSLVTGRSVAQIAGRLAPADLLQLQSIYSRPMTSDAAQAAESIVGYRKGTAASEFLDRQGQAAIDANPLLREAFGRGAKTSSELAKLQETISKLESERTQVESTIQKTFATQAAVAEATNKAISGIERELRRLLNDLSARSNVVGGKP